jgi:hypothetical protein
MSGGVGPLRFGGGAGILRDVGEFQVSVFFSRASWVDMGALGGHGRVREPGRGRRAHGAGGGRRLCGSARAPLAAWAFAA